MAALLLLISSLTWPTIFYVDSKNGNDRDDGLSPRSVWRTISKVKGASLQPGDFVLIKNGEIWRKELVIKHHGESGNSITSRPYGTGDKPIIPATGFVKRLGNGLVVGDNAQPLHLRGVNFAGYFMISAEGEWYTEGVERRFPSPDADIPVRCMKCGKIGSENDILHLLRRPVLTSSVFP